MSSRPYQADLFDPPAPVAPPRERPPPYSLEELAALGEQMQSFDRFPDEWCPGWWDMYERAHSTVWHAPRDQRAALRDGVFFREAKRLMDVDLREAEEAAAAARAAEKQARRKTRGGARSV